MSAGTGILHSEKNDSWRLTGERRSTDPVHFVQMWVVPDERGITPGYEQLDIGEELANGWAGRRGVGDGQVRRQRQRFSIQNRYAALLVATAADGRDSRTLPAAPFVHLYVAAGSVELEGAGDSARRRGPDRGERRSAGHGERTERGPGLGDARHSTPDPPHWRESERSSHFRAANVLFVRPLVTVALRSRLGARVAAWSGTYVKWSLGGRW